MAQSQPSLTQQALYRFVMQKAPIGREAKLIPHLFPGAISDQHIVATAQLQGDHNAHLTMSMPQLSHKVFIGITDAYPETFAELVASFSAESESNDALSIGHAENLNTPVLSQFGWDAVLMTSPSQLIKGFPNTARIGDEEYEFILITLITASEYRHWRKEGYTSLMEKFGAQKRDFFRFYQKNVGNTRVAIHPKTKVTKSVQSQKAAVKSSAPVQNTGPQKSAPIHTKRTGTQPGIQGNAPRQARREMPTPYTPQAITQQSIAQPHPAAPQRSAMATAGRQQPPPRATSGRPAQLQQRNGQYAAVPQMPAAGAINTPIANAAAPLTAAMATPKRGMPAVKPQTTNKAETPTKPSGIFGRRRRKSPMLEPEKPKANVPPVAPAFPDHAMPDIYQNDQLDCDPLRVNLGVEPSEAFIKGNTDALSVGHIPPEELFYDTAGEAEVTSNTMSQSAPARPASMQTPASSPNSMPRHAVAQHSAQQHTQPNAQPKAQPKAQQRPKALANASMHRQAGSTALAQDFNYDDAQIDTITDDDYQARPVNPAKFESKALKQPSPTRSGVVSKRMARQKHKPGTTKAERLAARGSKNRHKQTAKRMAKKQVTRRDQQLSALDDAITDQWASSIVSMNREKQAANAPDGLDFAMAHNDQTSLLELSQHPSHPPRSRWQVLSETALGTLLLVGGLFTTLYFVDTQIPTASVFPGVFAVAGIVTLASAFKDALRLEKAETSN